MMSEQCSEIVVALSAVQAEMPPITFDSQNPHFRNRYASLAHIMATVRPVLVKHGLAITQVVAGDNAALATILLHKSGQWIRSDVPILPEKPGAQAFGSAMSYARRYGVCGILAVAAEEDDDGEGASVRGEPQREAAPKPRYQKPPPAAAKPPPTAKKPVADEPEWFDSKLGVTKLKDKTWREMSEGGLGGGRHAMLEWMTKQATRDENEDEIKERAKTVLALYTKRETDAF